LTPSEHVVALVDMGLYGRALCIGSRLVGDVLQWFDGEELHLVRGQLLEDRTRRRCFEFERASDRQIFKFAQLTPEAFEKRFREQFPEAPRDCSAGELTSWLRQHHGLWP
jgi:hypothetical protein